MVRQAALVSAWRRLFRLATTLLPTVGENGPPQIGVGLAALVENALHDTGLARPLTDAIGRKRPSAGDGSPTFRLPVM